VDLVRELGNTRSALGRLVEGARQLPRPELLIRPLRKREAVLSSRIEGSVTTLEEAFVQEAAAAEPASDDAQEVLNYEAALRQGTEALGRGRKLSLSLLKELHTTLLTSVRGQQANPGQLRDTQVWLGGPESRGDIQRARFVPPPPTHVADCLEVFAAQLQTQTHDDPLVRVALAHYQFETIHPFADGNGRLGRLLMILHMLHERLLDNPWLYVSQFLEPDRDRYYGLLYGVSTEGQYLEWIRFFLEAVRSTAEDTLEIVQSLRRLKQDFQKRLRGARSRKPAQLLEELFAVPYITVPMAERSLQGTFGSARAAVHKLVQAGILRKMDRKLKGRGKGRGAELYCCTEVARLFGV
jgi:Fic family protein